MLRRVESRHIVTDGRVLGEIDHLRQTLQLVKDAERFNTQGLKDESPRIEQRLIELSTKAAAEAMTVTVEGLPAEEFDAIALRHPPSPEQLDRWREQSKVLPGYPMPEYNNRTMAPDLLKACLLEPEWSETWWRGLTRGAQDQIWNMALRVQVAGADLPFYNAATAMTTGGGVPLTSAANGEYR